MPDGTIFDAKYYAQAYPDVASEIGTDINALYNHYVTYEKSEGRLPTALAQANFPINPLVFDAIYYAQTYPDVVAAIETDPNDLYKHYLIYGRGGGSISNQSGNSWNRSKYWSAKNSNGSVKPRKKE